MSQLILFIHCTLVYLFLYPHFYISFYREWSSGGSISIYHISFSINEKLREVPLDIVAQYSLVAFLWGCISVSFLKIWSFSTEIVKLIYIFLVINFLISLLVALMISILSLLEESWEVDTIRYILLFQIIIPWHIAGYDFR